MTTKFIFRHKVAFVFSLLILSFYAVSAQTTPRVETTSLSLLQVLPFVTFVIALVTGMLNLYIMNKLGKTKEEVLTVVRSEFKVEITNLNNKMDNTMATKEQVTYMDRELKLLLKNIETKIDISSTIRDRYETRNPNPK